MPQNWHSTKITCHESHAIAVALNVIWCYCSVLLRPDESSIYEIIVFKQIMNKCYMSDSANGFVIQVSGISYH